MNIGMILMAMLLALSVTACGGDDDKTTTSRPTGDAALAITASTFTPRTQEEVRLTATGTEANSVAWSDNCRGEFASSDGTTTTWTTTWAETCQIRASAGAVTREVTLATTFQTGTVMTVAGTQCTFVGPGAGTPTVFPVEQSTPAGEAEFSHPYGVIAGRDGGIYFSDRFGGRVLKFVPETNRIEVVAGLLAGSDGVSGTAAGEAATTIALNSPWGLAEDDVGNLYIAEYDGAKLRKVFANSGTMVTLAQSINIMALDQAADGTFYYVEGNSDDNLFRFFPATGTSQTVVDLGDDNFDVSIDGTSGAIFTAQRFSHQILRVAPTASAVTVFAGTGAVGAEGNQVPATTATVHEPMGVFAAPGNKVFIAERGSARVRLVGPNGNIRTIVGRGINFSPGVTGPSTASPAIQPTDVTLDANGDLYFTDRGDCTLKKAFGPF